MNLTLASSFIQMILVSLQKLLLANKFTIQISRKWCTVDLKVHTNCSSVDQHNLEAFHLMHNAWHILPFVKHIYLVVHILNNHNWNHKKYTIEEPLNKPLNKRRTNDWSNHNWLCMNESQWNSCHDDKHVAYVWKVKYEKNHAVSQY
jgi:hypothetical protein